MSTLINNILPKYFKKIDHNLLINHPLIWSSKILHVLWIAIIVLIINLLLSWVYPLEFFNIPNRTIFFFYSCFYSSALFITWLFVQQLFDFQLIHKGKRTYHFKGLMLFYIITLIIFLSAFIPYSAFNSKINEFISDPNLPISLKNDYFFSRLNYYNIDTTDTNLSFEPEFLSDSLTGTLMVIKELRGYRNKTIKKLSDPAIAYLAIQQYYNDLEDFNIKYNDIDSTINFDGRKYIYDNSEQNKTKYLNALCSLKSYNEVPVKSTIFRSAIKKRTYFISSFTKDFKNDTLNIYIYKDRNLLTHYDFPGTVFYNMTRDTLTQHIESTTPKLTDFERTDLIENELRDHFYYYDYYSSILIFLVLAFFFALTVYIIKFFGYISYATSLFCSAFTIVSIIFITKTLTEDEEKFFLAFALFIISFLSLKRLGKLKGRKFYHTILLQIFTYMTLFFFALSCLWILTLIQKNNWNPTLLTKLNIQYLVISLSVFIFFIALPWSLLTHYYRLYITPKI